MADDKTKVTEQGFVAADVEKAAADIIAAKTVEQRLENIEKLLGLR